MILREQSADELLHKNPAFQEAFINNSYFRRAIEYLSCNHERISGHTLVLLLHLCTELNGVPDKIQEIQTTNCIGCALYIKATQNRRTEND